jgi:ribosome-binding protein aMBF1 (putative translation factor)
MRSKVSEWILESLTDEMKIFTDKYADLLVLIHTVMEQKGYSQKKLADRLGKQPSEIHKWLSGEHNLTLRTVSKLEAELNVTLLEVPLQKAISNFKSHGETVTFNVTVNRAVAKKIKQGATWDKPEFVKNKNSEVLEVKQYVG